MANRISYLQAPAHQGAMFDLCRRYRSVIPAEGEKLIILAVNQPCANIAQLFFEQFSIRSCVLNSELPINTRIKIIEEFNKVSICTSILRLSALEC